MSAETRLRLTVVFLTLNGVIFIIAGLFADVLFPALGWAHNPGFAGAQKLMVIYGGANLALAVFLTSDWFS